MTLEQQVCSLELAKKLRELGVKQESLFFYVASRQKRKDYFDNGKWIPKDCKLILGTKHDNTALVESHGYSRYFSAFTVAELGEMLPPFYRTMNVGMNGKFWFEVHHWIEKDPSFYAETEANARAVMLIYLLEHKLITL